MFAATDASYPEGDPLELRRQDSYLKKHPGIPEMLRHMAQDRAGERRAPGLLFQAVN